MKMYLQALAPAAVMGLTALFPGIALAQGSGLASSAPPRSGPPSYYAHLTPTTKSGGTGSAGITFEGDRAAIAISAMGLSPTPHVQTLDQGTCAAPTKVLNTLPRSGSTAPAATTDLATAPRGSSYTYHRIIPLPASTIKTIENGHAVVMVDGANPATPGHQATAPALCGALKST